MRTRADSPKKTCTEPGCDGALRARGLCSTHYNQRHQPNRHAAVETACTVCQAQVLRPAKSDRRPTCSVTCRTLLQHGVATGMTGQYDWANDAALRARRAGATVIEVFDRTDVFVRDNWTCQLCGFPVDATASPFDPSSPTVDHVVPLSRGGQHTMANVQCSHLGCNAAKQDRCEVTERDTPGTLPRGVPQAPDHRGGLRVPPRLIDFARAVD
ncbi:HNH endonuclease [Micromonospora sp. C41]|uniref:HNH endonuclease n=1 Tax=Micromonospora sp. C41 TaxID=2824878 RepID=UPI001B393ADC|nr:HNH endonuclease [Micromonospora sp. C41]MBQ1064490.1 HNH endonuclease [Micromonospora sp. C41]